MLVKCWKYSLLWIAKFGVIWTVCMTHLVYAIFFFPQKNSCFSSQKCLGITASKFQFYCMKYLMFCLKREHWRISISTNSYLSVWMIILRFTASSLVFDGLKNISQWGEMLNASAKPQIDIALTVFNATAKICRT